jgi:hypothetical protein
VPRGHAWSRFGCGPHVEGRELSEEVGGVEALASGEHAVALVGVAEKAVHALDEDRGGLREHGGDEVEFVTVSYWEDVAAMARLASADPTQIHHLDRDPEFLVALPTAVQVLEVGRRTATPAAPESVRQEVDGFDSVTFSVRASVSPDTSSTTSAVTPTPTARPHTRWSRSHRGIDGDADRRP